MSERTKEENEILLDFIDSYMEVDDDWIVVESYQALCLFNPFTGTKVKMWRFNSQKQVLMDKIYKLWVMNKGKSRDDLIMNTAMFMMKYIRYQKTLMTLRGRDFWREKFAEEGIEP